MKIKAVTEVEISNEDLFDAIKDKVGLSDYTIINGTLKRYDKISWDCYDWVTCEQDEFKIKRLEMLSELKKSFKVK